MNLNYLQVLSSFGAFLAKKKKKVKLENWRKRKIKEQGDYC